MRSLLYSVLPSCSVSVYGIYPCVTAEAVGRSVHLSAQYICTAGASRGSQRSKSDSTHEPVQSVRLSIHLNIVLVLV